MTSIRYITRRILFQGGNCLVKECVRPISKEIPAWWNNATQPVVPIESMGLVYLPTFTNKNQLNVGKSIPVPWILWGIIETTLSSILATCLFFKSFWKHNIKTDGSHERVASPKFQVVVLTCARVHQLPMLGMVISPSMTEFWNPYFMGPYKPRSGLGLMTLSPIIWKSWELIDSTRSHTCLLMVSRESE